VPDTIEATIRDAATIEVECEACGHQFSYEQVFLAKADVRQADPRADAVRAIKRLGDEMRSGFGKGDYSKLKWERCPNCGYTQSWMVKRARISQGLRIFLVPEIVLFFGSLIAAIVIPDPNVGGELLKYALIGVVVLPIVAVISMIVAFHPNKGRRADRFNPPNITFDAEKATRLEYLSVGNMPGDLPKV